MIDQVSTRDVSRQLGSAAGRWTRLLGTRILTYVTNHVVSRIPSFSLRRWWYGRILGLKLGRHAAIHLGCHVWNYGPRQVRRNGSRLGAYSHVNHNCCLDLRGSLMIGDQVSISQETTILTATHGVNDPDFRIEHQPVVIEDHVWVGARATILPGVTLGKGCVVGAASVVTRDIAPLTIVAGAPARPIGARDPAATKYILDDPLRLFE
jgi:acetyltransferase-like isoleucine patch superfamily enzyme